MNKLEPRSQNPEIICQTLKTLSQNAGRGVFAFRVVKAGPTSSPCSSIKVNTALQELWDYLFVNKKQRHSELKQFLQTTADHLKKGDAKEFLKGRDYTDLFLAAQKFNQTGAQCRAHSIGVFSELEGSVAIEHPLFPELQPVRISNVAQTKLANIPADQKAFTHKKGFLAQPKTYHYNAKVAEHSHLSTAFNIFCATQKERFCSWAGRVLEGLGHRASSLSNCHYFRKEEKPETIYSHDAPIAQADAPTSFWVGHATCLLRLPLTSHSGKTLAVNLITDPVEEDLHALFYPRMTKPGRTIAASPAIHVLLLSHNHLDHFHPSTIKRLLAQQPILIVPKNDAPMLKALGFKNVYEQSWWKTATLTLNQGQETAELKITTVPAHHHSGNSAFNLDCSLFSGYVIHGDRGKGDIYFAGDTARLSDDHIKTLRERFDIRSMFQPGGPDEARKDMEHTHQSSADGLWMHCKLMVKRLRETHPDLSKEEFMEEAKKLKTLYMHTKTYKLGNLHFDDTDTSVQNILRVLQADSSDQAALFASLKDHEQQVYKELLEIASEIKFEGIPLSSKDIALLLQKGIVIPKIGERTSL